MTQEDAISRGRTVVSSTEGVGREPEGRTCWRLLAFLFFLAVVDAAFDVDDRDEDRLGAMMFDK